MKKLLLIIAALLSAGTQYAQTDCSDLFISEYVEGTYNNKALELYNPTGFAITLENAYRLIRWSNGSIMSDQFPLYVLPLTGTIGSFATWVIIQDTLPPGQDTMVFPALRAKADWLAPYDYGGTTPGGNVAFWNGDDAISLQKKQVNGTWKDIDIFGEIGVRPLNGQGGTSPAGGWTDTKPYWRGTGAILTRQKTLIRKPGVKHGIDRITMSHYGDSTTGEWPNSFYAFAEYDSMPLNFFDNLGFHQCDCGTASLPAIADARALPVGSTVTVYGVVTNGSEFGNSIRYIQDATAGITAYKSGSFTGILRGDSMVVTGTLKNYNQLLEIDPVTSFIKLGSDKPLPEPAVITPGQMNEAYESELVKMTGVTFVSGGGIFAGNTNYNVTAGGETCQVRINVASNLVGTIIPTEEVTLVGICSQFHYTDPNLGYQLLLRDLDDIIFAGSILFTTPLSVTNITTSGFSLGWETNIAGTTELFFGRTPELELGHQSVAGTGTTHVISLAGLNPSDLIYVMAFSVASSDTGWSGLKPFITRSVSTGTIKPYFTRSVDTTVATGPHALQIYQAADDTCIAYINRAKYSVDVAIYNFTLEGISSIAGALNAAYDRGVIVRLVTDGSTFNPAIAELVAGIGKIARPGAGGVMHNKFMVIDGNSPDPNDPVVWTGSCNWTGQNINTDANNVVFIQDASLARVYTLEFNEMFGSSTAVPNPSNAKFGPEKTDNTPHELVIGGKRVELYFSPSDGVTQQIVDHIGTAGADLEVGTMLITRTVISNAIIARKEAGVAAEVVITNRATSDATVVATLGSALGNDFREYHEQGLLYSKMMVADQSDTLSDPFVWTGSHNWSDAANTVNDENSIVIHDAQTSNLFYQEFSERFNLAIPVSEHPVLDLGPDQTVAGGDTVTLDAGQFENYVWSTGELTQIIQVDSSGTGFGVKKIWCRVTNAYGVQSDTVRIYFRPPSIADARAMPVGSEVTVYGIATNGSEFGSSIRYMQDATAGIAAYKGGSFTNILRGDSMVVTGTLKNYNQLLEIDPVTSFIKLGSDNPLPEPSVITPGQLSEPYESELVKILNVTFVNGGGVFAGNTNYNVTASGETCQVRVNVASNLVGKLIPTEEVTLAGICSQFHYTDPYAGYQLLLRDTGDILPVGTAPLVTDHPIDQFVCLGDSAFFSVHATGSRPMNYQWQKNQEHIENAIDSVYSINGVQDTDQGFYRCIVSNAFGADTSDMAELTVPDSVPQSVVFGPRYVAEYEAAGYYVTGQPDHLYEFSVTGGYAIMHGFTSIMVQWGGLGYGYLYLVETDILTGCMADTVTVEVQIGNVGIHQPDNAKIKILPNPARDIIHVENIRDCSVYLCSVSGEIVLTGKGNQVDISSLAGGIYFISVADRDGTVVFRGKVLKY